MSVGPTTSLAAILAESASRRPDHPALLFEGESITYAQLWNQTRRIAGALQAQGVTPGDAVAIMYPNVPDFVRVYYAVLAIGAVVVPVHTLLKQAEIEHVLTSSGAVLFLVDPASAAGAQAAAERSGCPLIVSGSEHSGLDALAMAAEPITDYRPMNPLSPATMLFTSGTSGRSKGVLLSHFGLLEQTHVALIDTCDVRPTDVFGAALPLSHVFGQTNVLNTSFRRGATVALLRRFSASETLGELTRVSCTIFAGVPTMLITLLEAALGDAPRPDLRYVISGGSSLPRSVLESFSRVFGAPIYEGYGLSETSPR
jgi:long-chain acyl-CoA synthetase